MFYEYTNYIILTIQKYKYFNLNKKNVIMSPPLTVSLYSRISSCSTFSKSTNLTPQKYECKYYLLSKLNLVKENTRFLLKSHTSTAF